MEKINPIKLKDIAPYLPYKLKIQHSTTKEIVIVNGIYEQYDDGTFIYHWTKNYGTINASAHYYPMLRPISDLKNDIIHNGEKYNFWEGMFIPKYERDILEVWIKDDKAWLGNSVSPLIIEKLIEYHFDVFNLVEKKLAISFNELQSA